MKQNKANEDIRNRAAAAGVTLWKVAEKAGIADTTLSKWMRTELPRMDPRRVRLLIALEQLEAEGTGQHGTEEKQEAARVSEV